MTAGEFANWCVLWLNQDVTDFQFKTIIREARPFLSWTDLWQAAKESVKRGQHEGRCDNEDHSEDPCTIHLETGSRRRDLLIAWVLRLRSSE